MQDENKKIPAIHVDINSTAQKLMDLVVNLYPDKSHFIYELLQNAEDAHASMIKFVQYSDRLEVLHDGKPFTMSNFEALVNAGASDKVDDETKIGAFGIGFKSIFSICRKYEVYSDPKGRAHDMHGEEVFRSAYTVEDYFNCEPITSRWEINEGYTTKFVFYYAVRFASDKKFSDGETIDSIIDVIRGKLESLNSETLLFLKYLNIIEYDIRLENYKSSGAYMLKITDIKDNCYRVDTLSENSRDKTVSDSNSNSNCNEISYLVFGKSVAASNYERTVNVAFAFIEGKDGKWTFRPAPSPYISVFFPTSTESKLNFIVQGPYRTTPNRSEIRLNDDNRELASKTADLLCESIIAVKELKKLDLSFLNILPLYRSNFIGLSGNLLICLYDSVANLLKNEELLPCKYGGFTTAKNSMLVRGRDLSNLFTDNDLTILTKLDRPFHWLPDVITSNTYQDLHTYLSYGLGIREITPEKIPSWISNSPEFLPSKSSEWLVNFYNFLADQQSLFYSKGKPTEMMYVNFVKTQGGFFAAPLIISGKGVSKPNVFLSDDSGRKDFLFVDDEIYKQCRGFFDNILILSKPDYYDLWVADYKQRHGIPASDEQHLDDLMFLEEYLKDNRYSAELKKDVLPTCLKLKCFNKSEKVWKNPLSENIFFQISDDNTIRIEEYFRDIYSDVAAFIDTDYYKRIGIDPYSFKEIYGYGVKDKDKLLVYDKQNLVNGKWCSIYNIVSLEWALSFIRSNQDNRNSIVKSKVIFTLLVDNFSLISDQTFETLSEYPWLHTRDGFVCSNEISKHDIDENEYIAFYDNKDLCEKLNFLKDERDVEDEVTTLYGSFSDEKKEMFVQKWFKSQYGLSLGEVRDIIDNVDFSDDSDFPSYPIHDLKRLEDSILRDFKEAPEVKYIRVTYNERENRVPADVDVYANTMYSVSSSRKRACQLCHKFYYSTNKTQIEQKGKAQKELPAMYLCLCGDCSKKYKAFREDDGKYNKFVKLLTNITDDDLREHPVRVRCDFGFGEEELWFTQRHAAEVRGLVRIIKSQKMTIEKPQSDSPLKWSELEIGLRVQHKSYGQGEISGFSDDGKIFVRFDNPLLEIKEFSRYAFDTLKVIWIIG